MVIGTPVGGTHVENSTAATTLSVPYPAGITAGDLLLMFVAVNSATTATLPGSWTSIVEGWCGTGSQSPAIRWMYLIAGGSESGTVDVTTPNVVGKGRMWRVSGVDQSVPVDVVGANSFTAIGTSLTHPGITTTIPDCQVWVSGLRNSVGTGGVGRDQFPVHDVHHSERRLLPNPIYAGRLPDVEWVWCDRDDRFDTDSAAREGGNAFALRPASESATVTGTAASTLGGLTAAASGVRTVLGTAAAPLGALVGTASGTRTVVGTAAALLGVLGGTATGLRTVTGTAASTLGGLTAAASGVRTVLGTAAAPLGALVGTASGTRTVVGTVAASLGALTGAVVGVGPSSGA